MEKEGVGCWKEGHKKRENVRETLMRKRKISRPMEKDGDHDEDS